MEPLSATTSRQPYIGCLLAGSTGVMDYDFLFLAIILITLSSKTI